MLHQPMEEGGRAREAHIRANKCPACGHGDGSGGLACGHGDGSGGLSCGCGDGSGGLAGARYTGEPREAPGGGAPVSLGADQMEGSLGAESWAR